jgi:pimeloyl-ACP methyl ester carboxylesterase
LSDGAVVLGHSIGGTILIQALGERAPQVELAAIMLVSAPFVGEGGWPGEEFTLPSDLGAKLPKGVPVHLFQGRADEITPPVHADLYRRAIPQAEVHKLPGRDHQLNNDFGEVARAIRVLEMSALSP